LSNEDMDSQKPVLSVPESSQPDGPAPSAPASAAIGAATAGAAAHAASATNQTNGKAGTAANADFDGDVVPPISIPPRILMGAGPSASYPEALQAMGSNTLGHLDPQFIEIMGNVNTMLRRVFRTKNPITGAVSGTGTAGMETALCNLIEQGDEVIVCVAGYFSDRMRQMAERMGAKVTVLQRQWGTVFTPEEIEAALQKLSKPKLVAIVHAETSTGTLQPLEEIARLAHQYGALIVADAVTSIAGCPLLIDDWDIDVCFAGTQKCIGSPPGLAPITFGPRAMEAIYNRKTPVQSWYFDMSLVATYWGDSGAGGRAYHHTAPSNAIFGLHEALRHTLIEGLENRWARHEMHSRALMAGLTTLGLKPFAQEGHRLWQLNAVWIPEGIDDVEVRSRLLKKYDIEISGGLGDGKGKIWRIGTMGYSARHEYIRLVLAALENILSELGHPVTAGTATAAADAVYAEYENKHAGPELNGGSDMHDAAQTMNEQDRQTIGETVGAEEVAR
jgi:alanine-glyoxylate transaminase/serine-glyoxylate transaminase/serine-pyruvate transaminase